MATKKTPGMLDKVIDTVSSLFNIEQVPALPATKKAGTSSATHAPPKKTAVKRAPAAKRELMAPNGDKRFVRRDPAGRIKESADVGKSLAQDVRKSAKTVAKSGQGDKGDQKPMKRAPAKKTKAVAKKAPARKAAAKKAPAKKAPAKKAAAKKRTAK